MSIFLLRKPDGVEKLISLKNITTLEDAYAALRGSESVRGCVITTAKPEPETLTTWLQTLREYGVDFKALIGHDDTTIMATVTKVAYDLGLAVATDTYAYKIKAQLDSGMFDRPNVKDFIGELKETLDTEIKTSYIFSDNQIQIGTDSKDSTQVKMVVNGSISITKKDTAMQDMNKVLKTVTESALQKHNLSSVTTLSVTVNPYDELNPTNKAKRKPKLHF